MAWKRRGAWVIAGIGVLLAGAAATAVLITHESPAPAGRIAEAGTLRFSATEPAVSIRYPETFRTSELTNEDEDDRILLRLKPASKTAEPALITLRYEDKLKPITVHSRQELREALLAGIDKSYPQRFPGYQELERRSFTFGSRPAAELLFLYRGPAGQPVKQRFLLVVRDDDTAIYLAAQASEAAFALYDQDEFTDIFSSLAFP